MVLPWREWIVGKSASGATDADRGALFSCLHTLHERQQLTQQPIDIVLDSHTRVVAKEAVAPGTIQLPPCVLKPTKIVEQTEHPHAVNVTVKVARGTDEEPTNDGDPKAATPKKDGTQKAQTQKNGGTQDATRAKKAESADAGAEAEAHATLRTKEWFVLPEFKYPRKKEPPAVAAAGDADAAPVPVIWMWDEGGDDGMHPFWAVRRMTVAQLKQEQAQQDDGAPTIRFNCELVYRTVTCVCIAPCGDKTVNRTRMMTVPCLTNSIALVEGEELVLEIAERRKKNSTPQKRSWREVVKEDDKTKKKPKATDASAKAR